MKKPSTISVAIATYNEESNIGRCLDSVNSWVNQTIIVDGQSRDKTVSIAQRYKNTQVISTPNLKMFHTMKQMAIDKCTGDWVLQLDADEVVSQELKSEIQQILTKNPKSIPQNGFWIKRKNYFLGRFLTKGGQYPDPTIRLYKNGLGHLPCQSVHEQAKIKGRVGELENDLLHYADADFSRYLSRNNRYTSLMAQELKKQKVKINLFSFINYLLVQPTLTFCRIYFRHKGFVDGFPGLVFAYYSALCHRAAFIKYKNNQK